MKLCRLDSGALKAAGLVFLLAAVCNTTMAGTGPRPPSVPEIDPGSIISAVTLLIGGVLVLTDRRRLK